MIAGRTSELINGLRFGGAAGLVGGAIVVSAMRQAFVEEAGVGLELDVGIDQPTVALQDGLLVVDRAPTAV